MNSLTINQVADKIQCEFGGKKVPEWKMRRVVDDLVARRKLPNNRIMGARMVPTSKVGVVAAELQSIGWLPAPVAAAS